MAPTVGTHPSTSPLIAHLARANRLAAVAALTPFGLRPHHLVALSVLENGEQTQQCLASTVQIDPTNLVGVLNELEHAGLVLRRRDPADRRRHLVSLTEHGHVRLGEVRGALAASEDRILSALDDDERVRLFELLQLATSGLAPGAGGTVGTECADEPGEAECSDAIDAVTRPRA